MRIGDRELSFVDQIKSLPGVEQVLLFGSRARGTASSRSDIDLAVAYPSADVLRWQEVLDIVEAANTLLKIDCIRIDSLPDDQIKT